MKNKKKKMREKQKMKIINFNKSLKDFGINMKSLEIENDIYIVNTNTITRLVEYNDYPIEKLKAIKRILYFLSIYGFDDKPFNIHSDDLARIFTSTAGVYKRYLEIMYELDILKRQKTDNGWYVPGIQSSSYKFYNSYFKEDDISLVIFDKQRQIEYEIDDRLELDARYIETIMGLELPIDLVIEAEINNYHDSDMTIDTLRKRITRVLDFNKRRYITQGKKVDRVYHSVSNLSKVARKYLSYKKQIVRFHSIDIRNCQPLLLASVVDNKDKNYIESVENGTFYENFYSLSNDRDEVKVELYKSVFFYWNENNEYNKLFRELFPLTTQSIQEMKVESMAALLQNQEALLFNYLIPKKSKLFFTLFDSIYFDNYEDMFDLSAEIETFFLNKGLKVSLNIE